MLTPMIMVKVKSISGKNLLAMECGSTAVFFCVAARKFLIIWKENMDDVQWEKKNLLIDIAKDETIYGI